MLLKRNADYSYAKNNISEDTGWKTWYNWDVVRKHTGIINIILTIVLVICAFVFRSFFISNGILNLILSLVSALLIWLFVVVPLHEILHFVPYVGLRFGDKCIITINKGAVSALYDDITNRKSALVSLLLPVLVLSSGIAVFLFFSSALFKVFFTLLLVLNVFGSHTDVYMFFYIISNIHKTEMIFGRYVLPSKETQ